MTELEGELVSVAAHQESIDGRIQIAGPVIFPSALKRREPIDASVGRGNIRIEARGNRIDDLRQNAFHTPNEMDLSHHWRRRALLDSQLSSLNSVKERGSHGAFTLSTFSSEHH